MRKMFIAALFLALTGPGFAQAKPVMPVVAYASSVRTWADVTRGWIGTRRGEVRSAVSYWRGQRLGFTRAPRRGSAPAPLLGAGLPLLLTIGGLAGGWRLRKRRHA